MQNRFSRGYSPGSLVFIAGHAALAGRGGFITRPGFTGKEVPENGYAIADVFLHLSQGGLETRPYVDDDTNTR